MEFAYPPELPISSYVDEIKALLEEHQVVIVAGDTGSGKTTQLPKICLAMQPEHSGLIGCTQPRRLAATSVAQRVREELSPQGYLVGSKIRFQDHTSRNTRIKFMTDGILLAETRSDPLLRKYRVIIVDEAHERNLNIDFLLGYLHRLLKKRSDLQLIVTSATIDTATYARHFHNAPVLTVSGKTYPVEIVYLPSDPADEDLSYVEQCIEAAAMVHSSYPPGDTLIFLPTEKDIRNCCDVLRGRIPDRDILPLFGRLQSADQHKIFQPSQRPKIVIASNIAETSLTVPGIRYVIDCGLARVAAYNHRSRTTALPISPVSRANCDQRAGRCGRTGPGICFRLFSEEAYLNRPEFQVPEIQRANLAEVILQMVSLRLGDPFSFPFLDPPKPGAIREGYRILHELGALDDRDRLTQYGTIMSQLPIDPVISRIIIEASNTNCLKEALIISAALAIQDPRVRPAEKEQRADEAHTAFRHRHSDFIMLLNIWNRCLAEMQTFSWSALKRFCKTYYLSFQRMREWFDLYEQLTRLLHNQKQWPVNTVDASYESLHKTLLTGFFRQCARKKSGSHYLGIGNRELFLFPGNNRTAIGADWIMAGSFVETSRIFAVSVAMVEPEWIEATAGRFCSYSWANPRWQKRSGQVVADESVSLYGLVLISGRRVNFGTRDAKNIPEARKIFIQHALIDGEITGTYRFIISNRNMIDHWRATEAKLRRRDIVVDDTVIYDFYDTHLPEQVFDRRTLNALLKKHGDASLLMTESDIVLRQPDKRDLLDYPGTLSCGSATIDLSYHFEPGSEIDGVTAHLPDHLLDHIKSDRFEWLVPGLLPEKVAFMLKGLPKRIRKQLVPVNETVDRLLDDMELFQGNFLKQLSKSIFKFFKITVAGSDWPTELPDHLRMRYSILDKNGTELRSGRELCTLQHPNQSDAFAPPQTLLLPKDRDYEEQLQPILFQRWNFSGIRTTIPLYDGNGRVVSQHYAALKPATNYSGVHVVYLENRDEAQRLSRDGTRCLLQIALSDPFKQLKRYLKTTLTGPSTRWLAAEFGTLETVRERVMLYILDSLFPIDFDVISNGESYASHVEMIRKNGLFNPGRMIIDRLMSILRLRRDVNELIHKHQHQGGPNLKCATELERHLDLILPIDFLDRYASSDLDHVDRYVRGLSMRADRALHNPHKDQEKQARFSPFQKNAAACVKPGISRHKPCSSACHNYLMLVAELGISLFSPEIKTRVKISEKIIMQAWQEVITSCESLDTSTFAA